MRRVALISDIHGNAVALEAVLADIASDGTSPRTLWWSTVPVDRTLGSLRRAKMSIQPSRSPSRSSRRSSPLSFTLGAIR